MTTKDLDPATLRAVADAEEDIADEAARMADERRSAGDYVRVGISTGIALSHRKIAAKLRTLATRIDEKANADT